jgi:hypothetical protein
VQGFAAETIRAATLAYAPFEQLSVVGNLSNKLVGRWTDVHAFAAVVWFLVAGEQWFVEDQSGAARWFGGERRTLRSLVARGDRMHEALSSDPAILDELDAVIARGASPRPPQEAFEVEGAEPFRRALHERYPSSRQGVERYATIDAFAADLLPILERVAADWSRRANRERRPATVVRPTLFFSRSELGEVDPSYLVATLTAQPLHPPTPDFAFDIAPGKAAFQADGRIIAISGDRIVFFIGQQGYLVAQPKDAELARVLARTARVHVVPGLGYLFVGAEGVLCLQRGVWRALPMPPMEPDEAVEASFSGPSGLGVVTSGDSGLTTIWRTRDGASYEGPVEFGMNGGKVLAISDGPYGTLAVGSRGDRGRAIFVPFDGDEVPYTKGVVNKPPLRVAACGAGRDAWAAGEHGIFAFSPGRPAELEQTELARKPGPLALVDMVIDLVGSPWLLTSRSLLRREATAAEHAWRVVHERDPNEPAFVAMGFTPKGVHVLDERGGFVVITPADVARWTDEHSSPSR